MKVIHVLFVVVGMLLPLISALAPIIHDARTESQADSETPVPGSHGFGFGLFPPVLCIAIDENVTFSVVILPIVLLTLVGTTILILVIWKIHKVGFYRH